MECDFTAKLSRFYIYKQNNLIDKSQVDKTRLPSKQLTAEMAADKEANVGLLIVQ